MHEKLVRCFCRPKSSFLDLKCFKKIICSKIISAVDSRDTSLSCCKFLRVIGRITQGSKGTKCTLSLAPLWICTRYDFKFRVYDFLFMLIICPRPRGTVPLLTDKRRLIIGRQSGHDGHEEHRHVQHGGDAQGYLLTRLGRDHEHKPAHKGS